MIEMRTKSKELDGLMCAMFEAKGYEADTAMMGPQGLDGALMSRQNRR